MTLIKTITDEYHFWGWIKEAKARDSSYGNCFTLEGAKAVQAWYEELSESMDEPIEFDPIAWCVEFTEYDTIAEAYKEHMGDDTDLPVEQRRTTKAQQLEWFQDSTTVIELDNGHIILGEF